MTTAGVRRENTDVHCICRLSNSALAVNAHRKSVGAHNQTGQYDLTRTARTAAAAAFQRMGHKRACFITYRVACSSHVAARQCATKAAAHGPAGSATEVCSCTPRHPSNQARSVLGMQPQTDVKGGHARGLGMREEL